MDQNAINAASLVTWQGIAKNKIQVNNATVVMKEVIWQESAQKEIAKIKCNAISAMKWAISLENAKVKIT